MSFPLLMDRLRKKPQLVAVSALALALIFGPGLYHLIGLSLEQRRLDRRLAELSKRQETLTREQQRLASDPTYVEGLIRSTFKVVQPGEYVIPLDEPPRR
jgi:cell division protein FtsB